MLQEELGMPLRRYLRSGILQMLKSRRVGEPNCLRRFWMDVERRRVLKSQMWATPDIEKLDTDF
jgi:hypothetical protein